MSPSKTPARVFAPLENVFGRAAAGLAAGLLPTILLPILISVAVYITVGEWLWYPTRQALFDLTATLGGAQTSAAGSWIAGSITTWTLLYACAAYLVFHCLVMPGMPSGADVARLRPGATQVPTDSREETSGITETGTRHAPGSEAEPGWVETTRTCLTQPVAPLFAFVIGGFLGFEALMLGGVL